MIEGTDPVAAIATAQRLCTRCGATPTGEVRTCPECGAMVVEIRAPDDALIGKVIDERFEIRSLLGQGGMGSVYRAYQRSVDREVAVKVIDPRLARDLKSVRRFLREAKTASALSQPNTVTMFDFGQGADGYLYLVMELLKGRTLSEVVNDEGLFDLARAVRVGVQLCDALEAAHKMQIVHRDLKPANVMLLDEPAGRDLIKVLDFGIAKSVVTPDSDITETGQMVGTPRYMAPELIAGRAPGPAADLYSVGVMLVEITVGRSPFASGSLTELLTEKRRVPVLPDGVPPALRRIVERLLDPSPDRRHASAAALRMALTAALEGIVEDGAISRVERRERDRPTGDLRDRPTQDTEVLGAQSSPLEPPSVSIEITPMPSPRPRRRWLTIALVATGALAAATAGVLALRDPGTTAPTDVGTSDPAPPTPTPTPDPTPTPAPPPSEPDSEPAHLPDPPPKEGGSVDGAATGSAAHKKKKRPGKGTGSGSGSAKAKVEDKEPVKAPGDPCKRSPRPPECPPF